MMHRVAVSLGTLRASDGRVRLVDPTMLGTRHAGAGWSGRRGEGEEE